MIVPLTTWTLACLAQTPTTLSIDVEPSLEVRYSDAVLVRATLLTAGQPLSQQRIDFTLISEALEIRCLAGSMVSGDDGVAGPLHLRAVDGDCAEAFTGSDPDGEPYALEALFAGAGGYLASQAVATLKLHREDVTLRLLPEHVADLGETLSLIATVEDSDGVAPAGTLETSGRAPEGIAGVTLSFFVDLNDDGDFADVDEAVGEATTDAHGVASAAFDTTPWQGLPKAGLHLDAVRAQFSGDRRYKVAAALADLRLEPAPPDPARTLLSADPETAPADAYSTVTIEAALIDRFNNLLGPDYAPVEVAFEASHGTLLDAVQRDPATGSYRQALEAPGAPGTAVVTVSVAGVRGASIEVTFDGGCGCHGAPEQHTRGGVLSLGAAALAAGARLRRRRAL